ncbi:MAG: catechol 2,3-dioxygenase-like lactoylglutathione lyase family enzyme [Cyclobacteriaceae bacterium]|jgi:catechol 2,3-dioxygenase-like lactoylglutathione lyase family enzyme
MKQTLVNIALLVRDYDEAIDFYTKKLNFQLVEDTQLTPSKRWVRISPPESDGCCLLMAKAASPEQISQIGNQAGGRVFLFIHTDDFQRDFENLKAHHIEIIRGPIDEPYGTVAVFADLYGNLIDLIQPK